MQKPRNLGLLEKFANVRHTERTLFLDRSEVLSSKELTMIKVIRVLRLLKLTRLARSSRLAQRLEAPISLPYQHLALLRCVLVLVILCHWLASLWATTILLVPAGTPTWIDDIDTRQAAMDEGLGIDTRAEPLRVYIASFYFCSYTMTSVGYGDIGPQNIVERVVCTLIVLGAGLSWACVLGEVCAIVILGCKNNGAVYLSV
eukprot:s1742_g2.t1